ncbi:MAG: DoxX family membrane protein [Propionibacteriaceae bacterium]|nr:DoxX family membrane protein [Propionibacteriaceae bacterium]
MSPLRFLARSLFASAFIADGVHKVTQTNDVAPEAEKFTSSVAPVIQRVLPAKYSSYVPELPETWVRICGVAEIAGGVMFATGIGRRAGAVLLTKAGIMNVFMALPGKDTPKADRVHQRPDLLRRLALVGAAVLATRDLQGQPSLKWRRKHAARKVAKASARVKKQVMSS